MAEVNFAFLCRNLTRHENMIDARNIGVTGIVDGSSAMNEVLWAVISLKYTAGEVGTHRLGLHCVDLDGSRMVDPLSVDVDFPPLRPGEFYGFQRALIDIRGELPPPGEYWFTWYMNDVEMHRMGLRIYPKPTN